MTKDSSTRRSAILAIILVSYVMIVLDISIVITGLPKIHTDLGFTDAGLSWVSSAYTLTFGGFLLLGARAGDILGRRRMFIIGLGIFAISSVLIGFAQAPVWLISARAIQGIGSAILAPSTLALLQTNFPAGPERTRAISYYASAAGISASIGLVLGGILAEWLSWRVGFFINLPIAAALIIATRKNVEETERRSGTFDIAGAILSMAAMTALVFGFVNAAETGWQNDVTDISLLAGIVLLIAFVFAEWRARQPIMPLRLFASRERSGAYLARMLFLGANVGFFFFATQFMQSVGHYSPAMTGLAFLPAMVVNFVSALMAPRLMRKIGQGPVLAGSILLGMLGVGWLTQLTSSTTYLGGLALPMLLIGIGQGGALGPLTTSGISNVATEDAGAASGLVNVAHQLGSSLGLGVLVAAASFNADAFAGIALLTHRVTNAMTAGTVMLGAALLVVSLLIIRSPEGSRSIKTSA
ncbi:MULTISPECIES: MFS transporter [Alphaproteobacteria]|uniref:MFS transporter n=1 Tax=Alphaproteobacteria TaxID=28211 RepID=UPI003A8FC627